MRGSCYLSTISALVLLVLLPGCTNTTKDLAASGIFSNGLYKNEHFGLTIRLPDDWYVLSREQTEALYRVGQMAAGEDEEMKKRYKQEMERKAMLLTAFMYPVPKTDGFNPSFGCMAEDMKYLPGIPSGKQYLELVKNSQGLGQVKSAYPSRIENVNIGGREFHSLRIESTLGEYRTTQRFTATAHKGFILTFLSTSDSEMASTAMERIFQSIEFKN